jgi:hypothetical protein
MQSNNSALRTECTPLARNASNAEADFFVASLSPTKSIMGRQNCRYLIRDTDASVHSLRSGYVGMSLNAQKGRNGYQLVAGLLLGLLRRK